VFHLYHYPKLWIEHGQPAAQSLQALLQINVKHFLSKTITANNHNIIYKFYNNSFTIKPVQFFSKDLARLAVLIKYCFDLFMHLYKSAIMPRIIKI